MSLCASQFSAEVNPVQPLETFYYGFDYKPSSLDDDDDNFDNEVSPATAADIILLADRHCLAQLKQVGLARQ